MNDVARVEVLKGPQNAFFGRSTFGGAVNFITKNPSGSLKGSVNTMIDHHGSVDVDATIEGPLAEDLATGRLSFGSSNKAARFRASDGGALGAESTRFVTGTVYLTPTDDLWLRLRGHFQKDDDSSPATAMVSSAGNTSCTGKGLQRHRSRRQPRRLHAGHGLLLRRYPDAEVPGRRRHQRQYRDSRSRLRGVCQQRPQRSFPGQGAQARPHRHAA
jgi:outer membrane receptor protein involved in Fe transport